MEGMTAGKFEAHERVAALLKLQLVNQGKFEGVDEWPK